MRLRTLAAGLATLQCAAAGRAATQDSPFAIRGLGMPGRFESVRARATGGAFAAFDLLSALADVSIVSATRLSATAAGAGSYLHDDLNGVSTDRRTGRFPLLQVSGPVGGGLVLGGGFTTYLDRSYRVAIADTLVLDGSRQVVSDNLSSDGGISDLRIAAARQFGPLAVGAGFHLLSGSARVRAERVFSDTSVYRSVAEVSEIAYTGAGYSASAILTVARGLALAGYWRSDTHLTSTIDSTTVASNDLPVTTGGALRWQPTPAVIIGASVTRRTWAGTVSAGAYNTVGWSAGLQVGPSRLPLRLGVRGGQLPFGPGGVAPREWAAAAGSGVTFAGGQGVIDFAVERLRRTGSGLSETVWTGLFGLTVRP